MLRTLLPFCIAAAPFLASAQTPSYEPKFGQSGVDLGAMDTGVSACTNFYQYACGNWRANNPVPSDQSRWSRFNELFERNRKISRDILEKAAQPSPNRSPLDAQIGDYYSSCLNVEAIDRQGIQPIQSTLDRIQALTAAPGTLAAEIARLQKIGVGAIFRFESEPDAKNASIEIAALDQGGLSLPDRDFYLKTDPRSVEIRTQFQQHVANMFDLLAKASHATWDSKAKAKAVLQFETALATSSMDRVSRRNPDNTYHPMKPSELPSLTPDFDWKLYLSDFSTPPIQKINVSSPGFFKGLSPLLKETPLEDVKTYLQWRLLLAYAGALPEPFVNENFAFYGKILTGQQEIEARWKRCVQSVDRGLGEALGRKFVEVAFSGPAKGRALEMVNEIEKAMRQDIQTAAWMTDATKQQALSKLTAVSNKIGYPDKWRDYSSIEIKRDDFVGNRERATAFEIHRELNKIGKPVDKSEWGMTPPTVNAYYNPPENNINFPAGILQPPFYSAKADDAVNYGSIGVVVGHELTHGFDDQGRRYDGEGNVRDWWTAADAKKFTDRADCVVKEYGAFSPVDGVSLNGKLTLGENAADNGGIHLAYMALMDHLAAKTLPKRDGFTPSQLFFLGYAQIWCENTRDPELRRRAVVDPHSPGQFRVNGVVQNVKEFQNAFACHAGDPMVSSDPCRVW